MPPVFSKNSVQTTSTVATLLKAIVQGNASRTKIASLIVLAFSSAWFVSNQLKQHGRKSTGPDLSVFVDSNKDGKNKVAIDKTFFRISTLPGVVRYLAKRRNKDAKLCRLLRILVPRFLCKETFLLLGVAISLIGRTMCDLWMIQNGTSVENAIIGRNTERFQHYLIKFLWAMPLLSIVNNTLKYSIDELKLSFRSRLTNHLYSKYLSGFTYYWLSNLDSRIANPDQVLTQDIEKFCTAIVDLYSNLCKPVLDVILYVQYLGTSMGFSGPAQLLGYLVLSGIFLTNLRKPVARMTVREQALEGQFRFVNSRLITSAEEIAFYDGANREKKTIENVFASLIQHLRSLLHFRIAMGLVDNIVAKYFGTVVGYWAVSRPFLDFDNAKFLNSTHDERLQSYYESGRMMYKMAEATGRIVLAGREMARLAGFTDRVAGLVDTLNEVSAGEFQRVQANSNISPTKSSNPVKVVNLPPESCSRINVSVSDQGVIKFDHIKLVTPNGDCLISDLSFEVRAGQNVLISGPNGSGKSSLFRVLCGLWPAFPAANSTVSELVKPQRGRLFYVPQKPYLCAGTLRDQVIYPDSLTVMQQKGLTDEDLIPLLDTVQLTYVLEREGGFDSVKNWFDVLSGGEKQRIAMARLFYHRPQFAILDECTSAVSADAEDGIYNRCRSLGITLFTVSHRKSLWKHHEFVLYLDGRGDFSFSPITAETEPFGS